MLYFVLMSGDISQWAIIHMTEVKCFPELAAFVQQMPVLQKSRDNAEWISSAGHFSRGLKVRVSLVPCEIYKGKIV